MEKFRHSQLVPDNQSLIKVFIILNQQSFGTRITFLKLNQQLMNKFVLVCRNNLQKSCLQIERALICYRQRSYSINTFIYVCMYVLCINKANEFVIKIFFICFHLLCLTILYYFICEVYLYVVCPACAMPSRPSSLITHFSTSDRFSEPSLNNNILQFLFTFIPFFLLFKDALQQWIYYSLEFTPDFHVL